MCLGRATAASHDAEQLRLTPPDCRRGGAVASGYRFAPAAGPPPQASGFVVSAFSFGRGMRLSSSAATIESCPSS
jgi:hypothetical protein